jgi:hypothetical protein
MYRQRFKSIDTEFKYFKPKKLLPSSQKYGLDPGSGIRKKVNHGSRGKKATGSATLYSTALSDSYGTWLPRESNSHQATENGSVLMHRTEMSEDIIKIFVTRWF